MSEKILKFLWELGGIAGIAMICWSFWEVESGEALLIDMVWLLLAGVSALSGACFAFRAWEKSITYYSAKNKK